MNAEELLQLRSDVEALKLETTALRHIVKVLAVGLCQVSPDSAKRTKALLSALIPYGNFAENPPCGEKIRPFVHDVLESTAQGVDPLQLLMLHAQLAKEAGPHRLDALRLWLSQATVEEITQDVQRVREMWMPPGDGLSDGPSSRSE